MKKIYSLLLALSLSVIYANAVEVTLWQGTYSGNIEIKQDTVNNFIPGDVLRVYATVPEGGANFKLWYNGEKAGWHETAIPSINEQWPWINGDKTYYGLTFTADDTTALKGNNIYVAKGDYSTITRVSAIMQDLQPGEERELWSGSDTLKWNEIAEQTITAALLGENDKIIVTVSAKGSAGYPKVLLRDKNSGQVGDDISLDDVSVFPYNAEFTLTSANVTAMQNGFKLSGDSVTVTKMVLKKYDSPTTIDEVSQSQGQSQKLIRNGQLFIIRDDKTYTIQGQRVH